MEYIKYGIYLLIILVTYLMVTLPGKRQEKLMKQMQEELKIGDKITTYSGIVGKIISVEEEDVIIQSEPDDVKFTIGKWSVIEVKE